MTASASALFPGASTGCHAATQGFAALYAFFIHVKQLSKLALIIRPLAASATQQAPAAFLGIQYRNQPWRSGTPRESLLRKLQKLQKSHQETSGEALCWLRCTAGMHVAPVHVLLASAHHGATRDFPFQIRGADMKPMKTLAMSLSIAGLISLSACDNSDMRNAGQATKDAAGTVADASKNAASETGQAAKDAMITTKVKSALLAMPDLKSTDISVETSSGKVVLSGTVADENQKTQVVDNVRKIDGVVDVQSNLIVAPS